MYLSQYIINTIVYMDRYNMNVSIREADCTVSLLHIHCSSADSTLEQRGIFWKAKGSNRLLEK